MDRLERDLKNTFVYFVSSHGNGRWATNELEYKVFHDNYFNFYNLSEEFQWIVRMYIKALRFIYGEKQFGDL